MAEGVATPVQEQMLKPFSQRLYAGDLDYSKSYIYQYFNEVTRLVGEDLVLKGLEVVDLAHTADDITVTVAPGFIIQDKAFIDLGASNMPLTFVNASNFDAAGQFVVYGKYRNLISIEQNSFALAGMYVNLNGSPHEPWNHDMNRIVFAAISFTKGVSGIESVSVAMGGDITIDGNLYKIRPTRYDSMIETSLDGGILP